MPRLAAEGLGHPTAGDLVEIAAGRSDPVPIERYLADTQPNPTKVGLTEASDHEVSPVGTLLQDQARATFGAKQVLGGDQGDLAAVGCAPVTRVIGIAVADKPATNDGFGRFERLHPSTRLSGDVDADQVGWAAFAQQAMEPPQASHSSNQQSGTNRSAGLRPPWTPICSNGFSCASC